MPERLEVDFYYQITCPYCSAIKHYVLLDMLEEIDLNEIDVEASNSEKVEKWRRVCLNKWGKGVTPIARVGNYWIPVWKGGDKESATEKFRGRLEEAIERTKKKRERPDYPEVAILENLPTTSVPEKGVEVWDEHFEPNPDFEEMEKLRGMLA